ncbi:MAG: hypothetical protein AAB919_02975 [Patescibacteria group bacterium]
MANPTQGRCLPHVTCKFCGAGPQNSNKHDEDCLINVPSAEAIPIWRWGYDDAKSGKITSVLANSSVYLMGRRLAKKNAPAEHAATSPERGVGLDLTL